MRWILINCFLLATAADVLSVNRPKRDLSHIKNFIASKLIGTETIVIQQPEIPKNETYQLFKIKGYDNILLKVIRKQNKYEDKEQEQVVTEKVPDPVIVSPEIAIIGNYLGTTTQGETLLAIEIAKNLLKSGILRGAREKIIQEAVVPMTSQLFNQDYIAPKPVNSVNVFAEEKNPVYFLPAVSDQAERIRVVNRNLAPVSSAKYSPLVVASELHYRPLQTKYSYKQKGDTADMTYESYNNQDVVVTRTDKEPPIPQYIKMRIADVASLGANPYLIRSQQPVAVIHEEHVVQPINLVSGSYDYLNPLMEVQGIMQPAPIPTYVINRLHMKSKPADSLKAVEKLGYVVSSNQNPAILNDTNPSVFSESVALPNFMNTSKLHFDIRDHLSDAEIDKINRFINEKLNISRDIENALSLNITSTKYNVSKENLNENQEEINKEERKSFTVSKEKKTKSHIVTKYIYNQLNHRSHDNYTVVNLENPGRLNQSHPAKTNIVKSSDELPKDFVYVPPKNINVPLPNTIPKTNDMHYQKNNNSVKINGSIENYTNDFFLNKPSNVKEATKTTEKLKVSGPYSLKENPIVVLDHKSDKEQVDSETYRGDNTSFRSYVGGPVF